MSIFYHFTNGDYYNVPYLYFFLVMFELSWLEFVCVHAYTHTNIHAESEFS